MNLIELKKEIPFQWKPNNKVGNKMLCVAYIDARQARDLLDNVCGPENWMSDYQEIKGNIYCGIGIRVKRDVSSDWVWKWDCGTESNTEKEKGEASDAFKRACVQWGIGRFLYDMEMVKLDMKQHTNGKNYPTDSKGNIIWDNKVLTEYINELRGSKTPVTTTTSHNDSPRYTGRYDSSKGGADVVYETGHGFTQKTISKVRSLEKDGKKGKEVLLNYLPDFNKENGTDYKAITGIKDKELQKLIQFIEDRPPPNL